MWKMHMPDEYFLLRLLMTLFQGAFWTFKILHNPKQPEFHIILSLKVWSWIVSRAGILSVLD